MRNVGKFIEVDVTMDLREVEYEGVNWIKPAQGSVR